MSQTVLPAATRTGPTRPTDRRGLALAVIVICQLMLVLDATVMNVALPRIQASLHFSPTSLSWVMNSYTIAFGGLLLLGGKAGDLLGRRRMFVAGLVVFSIASLAGGLAPTAGLLIAARLGQGVGAALAGPSTIALVATTFTEPAARIRAMALLSAVATGGFAIGLILGGVLTEFFSWRAVMFINVPFGVAAALLAPRLIAEPERHRGRLDVGGAILATAGMGSLVFGLIHAATFGWSTGTSVATLTAGVLLLAAFLVVEARLPYPLLPLRLFAERNRAAGYLNFLLGPAAMMSMFFFLTQFLQDVRGFGALATGFAFLPMAVAMFAMTRVVPRLLTQAGPRPLVVVGTSVMVVGLAWLSRLDTTSTYWSSVFGPMVLMGLGAGLAFVPLSPVIFATVPPADAGAAGGALQTMQQTGATLGLAVLVTVYGAGLRAAGAAGPVGGMVHAMGRAFTVSAGIAVATILAGLTFRQSQGQVATATR